MLRQAGRYASTTPVTDRQVEGRMDLIIAAREAREALRTAFAKMTQVEELARQLNIDAEMAKRHASLLEGYQEIDRRYQP